MNLSYRLVWSAVRKAWVVVSELAKSHAKSGALVVATTAAFAANTQAAPPQEAEGAGKELMWYLALTKVLILK